MTFRATLAEQEDQLTDDGPPPMPEAPGGAPGPRFGGEHDLTLGIRKRMPSEYPDGRLGLLMPNGPVPRIL